MPAAVMHPRLATALPSSTPSPTRSFASIKERDLLGMKPEDVLELLAAPGDNFAKRQYAALIEQAIDNHAAKEKLIQLYIKLQEYDEALADEVRAAREEKSERQPVRAPQWIFEFLPTKLIPTLSSLVSTVSSFLQKNDWAGLAKNIFRGLSQLSTEQVTELENSFIHRMEATPESLRSKGVALPKTADQSVVWARAAASSNIQIFDMFRAAEEKVKAKEAPDVTPDPDGPEI